MITINMNIDDYCTMYEALLDQIHEEEKAACGLGTFKDYFSQDMSASHTQKALELQRIADDLRAAQADEEFIAWEKLYATGSNRIQAAG